MITPTKELLKAAQNGAYAVGAFNVYNLEGVKAVLAAAEAENSPVMLQIHPSALKYAGIPLIALSLEAAKQARIPTAVHLDHSTSQADIFTALEAGVQSVMADGSHTNLYENINFTQKMVQAARHFNAIVEAELGRLSGTEDGLTVPEYEALLTNPQEASDFCKNTEIDALAVCIGNVHGHYHGEPRLDFSRLEQIRQLVGIPLVLHGASGLPAAMVRQAVEIGVQKFNVNTELRDAYIASLRKTTATERRLDLVEVLEASVIAMRGVVTEKLQLFGSSGKAL